MTACGYATGAEEIAEVDATGGEAAVAGENVVVAENEALEESVIGAAQSFDGAEEEVVAATPRALEAASVKPRAIEQRKYFLAASWRMATAPAPLTREEKPLERPQAIHHARMVANLKMRVETAILGSSPRTHGCEGA